MNAASIPSVIKSLVAQEKPENYEVMPFVAVVEASGDYTSSEYNGFLILVGEPQNVRIESLEGATYLHPLSASEVPEQAHVFANSVTISNTDASHQAIEFVKLTFYHPKPLRNA